MLLKVRLLTVIVATSYVTLGVFAPHQAKTLWWHYGLTTFVLAIAALWMERRGRA